MDPQIVMPLLIGGLAFGAIALLIVSLADLFATSKGPARTRLTAYTAPPAATEDSDEGGSILRDRRLSRFDSVNRFLVENRLAQNTAISLAQARIPLKVGEYMLLRFLLALATGWILLAIGGSALAVLPGAMIGFFAPHVYVEYRRGQRIRTLELQLVDALSLAANSLRAGWGFNQAMAQIASELPPPISEEFNEILQEVSIGATPEAAINNMILRVGSYDVELVMTGVLIQRQIGGNLAEMMDKTVTTIRERIRLLADIQSIVAESRLSMWLLGLLPIFLLIFLSLTMPGYMLPFLEDPRGRLMLVAGGIFEVLGVIVMKRISNIEV